MLIILARRQATIDSDEEDSEEDPDPVLLLKLLKSSRRWAISSVEATAVKGLEECAEIGLFSPAMQFAVASEMKISHWYRPALTALLKRITLAIDREDLPHFKGDTLQELLFWKNRIDKKRTSVLVSYPTSCIAIECEDNNICCNILVKLWQELALSDVPLRDSVHRLVGDIGNSSICNPCRMETLEKIEESGIAYAEDDLIKEAVENLYSKHFGDSAAI
jgi:hypothetical protein